jgi:DNA-binding transcriptional LysR family regulator
MSLTAALRDLNKINAFVRVAERRSFTKAAVDLRTTPSVISKHMTELEQSLGFSLFHRSTHAIELTDAGEGLFQNCLQMLAQLDDYIVDTRNLKTGPFGMLRVQAASGYARTVLAPLVVEFARLRPGLRVDLSVLPGDGASVEEGTDVIVAPRKPSLPGLVAHDLGAVPQVICASSGYFRQFGRPKEPQELRQHNCLANVASGSKRWPFKSRSRPLLGRGERTALLEQRRGADPDGAPRLRDHPRSAPCGQSRACGQAARADLRGPLALAGAHARLFLEGQALAGEDRRFHPISARLARRALKHFPEKTCPRESGGGHGFSVRKCDHSIKLECFAGQLNPESTLAQLRRFDCGAGIFLDASD